MAPFIGRSPGRSETKPVKPALLPLAAAFLFAAPNPAQAEPPERTTTAVVYGNEKCPEPEDPEEIVVCGKRPETERYRIPKEFREDKSKRPDEVAWGSRVGLLEEASRANIPGSCTPVGSYGQTGCRQQMINSWYQDRAARQRR